MKNKKETNSLVVWGVIIVVIVILFFLSISVYKEFSKKKKIESDIQALKDQAEKIKQENMTLEERIAYLGSQDYQKVQARDKLDLQDPEENVVVITQDSASLGQESKNEDNLENNNSNQENYSSEDSSNFLKWWNYFFKK